MVNLKKRRPPFKGKITKLQNQLDEIIVKDPLPQELRIISGKGRFGTDKREEEDCQQEEFLQSTDSV